MSALSRCLVLGPPQPLCCHQQGPEEAEAVSIGAHGALGDQGSVSVLAAVAGRGLGTPCYPGSRNKSWGSPGQEAWGPSTALEQPGTFMGSEPHHTSPGAS